jgi:hypothetical protein
MKMTKKSQNKVYIVVVLLVVGLLVCVAVLHRFSIVNISSISKPSEESFKAPGKNWPSQKKVEDYFVDHLHMTLQEAKDSRSPARGNDGNINLRLTQGTTIPALLSNLEYYGFVRDQNSLQYALEHTVDTLPGHQEALKVGNNTVDLWASYNISEDMTAWEIADQLLNHPSYFAYDEYGYMFMP